jgi:hypothetical protein
MGAHASAPLRISLSDHRERRAIDECEASAAEVDDGGTVIDASIVGNR